MRIIPSQRESKRARESEVGRERERQTERGGGERERQGERAGEQKSEIERDRQRAKVRE
jgi:hypothetical protein